MTELNWTETETAAPDPITFMNPEPKFNWGKNCNTSFFSRKYTDSFSNFSYTGKVDFHCILKESFYFILFVSCHFHHIIYIVVPVWMGKKKIIWSLCYLKDFLSWLLHPLVAKIHHLLKTQGPDINPLLFQISTKIVKTWQ